MDPVFDRSVISADKIFIKAHKENNRAYVIQEGLVRSFTTDENGEEIEIARFGPGTIIGECCLVVDDLIPVNYQALDPTTVMTITRADFEKKFSKTDNVVQTIIMTLTEKLMMQDASALEKAMNKPEIDETALSLVKSFTNGLPEERKKIYEETLLPHINGMITAIKEIKRETGQAL